MLIDKITGASSHSRIVLYFLSASKRSSMMGYTLYKQPVQIETLAIVQYLKFQGIHAEPSLIVERNHPNWVTELPSIIASNGERFLGLSECVKFYGKHSGIDDLYSKSKAWKAVNENFHTRVKNF
jgi:hypothetical protein